MTHLRLSVSVLLLFAAFPGPVARADWITLDDGRRLRGVDLTRRGNTVRFTLEDGRTIAFPAARLEAHERAPEPDLVTFRGETVTLAAKVRRLQAEAARRREEGRTSLELWASDGAGAEAARRVFAELPDSEREPLLVEALLKADSRATRRLAARELVAASSAYAASVLAAAAVVDVDPDVREASLTSLRVLDHERSAEFLLPFVISSQERHRLRASRALARFPDERAVPVLLSVLNRVWNDFGRGYFFNGVERAYIADYELVSGGTGFNIIEVADPVVRTFRTGVVLDVDVNRVEAETHLATLRRITGADAGNDPGAWLAWWRQREGSR